MSTVVRELVARLRLSTDRGSFDEGERALDRQNDGLSRMTKNLSIAAAAYAGLRVVRGVAGMTRDIIATGDRIDKFSQQIGVSRRELQEFEFIAQRSGVAVGELRNGIARLQRNVADAAEGRGRPAEIFRDLGVEVEDGTGKLRDARDIIGDVADAISGMEDEGRQTAIAMELFGRSGSNMVPLLRMGAAGIDELRLKAEGLGGMLSDDLIDASRAFADQQADTGLAMDGLRHRILGGQIPAWTRMSKAMETLATNPTIRGFADALGRSMTRMADRVARGMEWISDRADVLGNTLTALRPVAVGVFSVISLWAARAAVAFLLPMAPILLIGGLVAGLALELSGFFQGQDTLIGRWVDKWKDAGGYIGHFAQLLDDFRGDGSYAMDMFVLDVEHAFGGLWRFLRRFWDGFMEMVSMGAIHAKDTINTLAFWRDDRSERAAEIDADRDSAVREFAVRRQLRANESAEAQARYDARQQEALQRDEDRIAARAAEARAQAAASATAAPAQGMAQDTRGRGAPANVTINADVDINQAPGQSSAAAGREASESLMQDLQRQMRQLHLANQEA